MNKFILLLGFVMHFTFATAQKESISIHIDSILFRSAISELQTLTGYTFFYNPDWVSSRRISLEAQNQSLESVLQQIRQQTGLNNIIVEKKVLFIKDYYIKTNFKEEYSAFILKEKVVKDTVQYTLPRPVEEKINTINPEYKLIKIGNPAAIPDNPNATLHGYIRDSETGEPLIGVIVYFEKLKKGDATNAYGFYSITIPKGQYRVEYRNVGRKTTYRNIDIQSDGQLDLEMKIQLTLLNEVLVTAKSEDKMKNLSMGVEKITAKTMMQLPSGLGEPDLIKSALLLPGVQSVSEAANGFNVRGGSTDQNLFLLNGASILNTSHFFGFFSGFNSDLIKDITLYKSSIPAEFGGRVSSVMDITLKEGSRKDIKTYGAISPVSGRFTAEVPVIKDKSSLIISSRATYSDLILKMLNDKQLKNSSAGFYDILGNFSYEFDKLNTFYLSGYYSHDRFDYFHEDAFKINTLASTAKWKHIFTPRLFSTFSGIVSNYNYTLDSRQNPYNLYSMRYSLQQYNLKADLNYRPTIRDKINFGFNSIWYSHSPGDRKPLSDSSLIAPHRMDRERALESAIYLNYEIEISPRLSLSAGLRYSFYMMFGPKTVYNYPQDQPINLITLADTTYYPAGRIIKYYSGPEPRISAKFSLSSNSSLKIGYTRMIQYIQMISTTTAMAPTDVWKLSDNYFAPQRGDQISVGLYNNLRGNTIEASIEAYYKSMSNIIDYKGGAQLLMNEHLETDVVRGKGKAYGIELMMEKKSGQLTGWVNYTYSRVLHKINGPFEEEIVNSGVYFPANYDKPHNFKFVANFKFSRRVNLSTNFFYSTGRPYTMFLALYNFKDAPRIYYSDRNSYRMEDYIRLDMAATINGNLKVRKLNHSSWTFSLFNVLGRRNPYSVYFKMVNQRVTGYKMSIFGQPIFTVTYNFKIFGNATDDF